MIAFAIWMTGLAIAIDFNIYVRHVVGKEPYPESTDKTLSQIYGIVGSILFIIGLFK